MLPADISRCRGEHCSVKEHCLRYTTPAVPDHPRQALMSSPHTESSEVECGVFMYDLKVGDRAKFFHPGTMGVMHPAKVLEIVDNGRVRVRFDIPHPTNGRKVFVVPPNHNPE